MKKFIFFLVLFFGFGLVVNADDSLIIKCDDNKINVGEQLICRLSVSYSKNYDMVNYKIEIEDGISLVDIRSNYNGLWTVNKDRASASSVVSGLQEFGILLIKAKEYGEYKININNIEVVNGDKSFALEDVSTSIKVISKDNYLNDIKINGESIEDFDKNNLKYSYETDLEELDIEVSTVSEFATVSGDGKIKISNNSKVTFIPIKVMSESGAVRSYIIEVINKSFEDNKLDKELKDIVIKDNNDKVVDFKLKSGVYYYDLQVSKNVDSVDIACELKDKTVSLVKSYAGGKSKLDYGQNTFIIKVKDEDSKVLNYLINITRPIDSLSSNSYISVLGVDNYDIKFNKRVKNYNLEIDKRTKKLDFNIKLEDGNSHYKVVGNENLKDGSVIKIVVTAPDASSTVYTINILVKKFNFMSLIKYFVIILGGFILYKNRDKFVISLDKMNYDKLLVKYNNLFEEKGITKNFLKLSEDVRREILIISLKENKLANKTDLYKEATKEFNKTVSKKPSKKTSIKSTKKSNSKSKKSVKKKKK